MELIKSFNHLLTAGLFILAVFGFAAMFKVIKQYERAVVFRLGKYIGTKGPGLIWLFPLLDRAVKVDVRVHSIDVPRQEIITKDNISVVVDAVVYYRVDNPEKAIIQISNAAEATFLIAQTTLRSIIGQVELDVLLSQRDEVNASLTRIIDAHTLPWGIKVTIVELKELALPEEMKRAMARVAEAERERKAKIIGADGEYQAAQKLKEAGEILGDPKAAVQLRYLQTLSEISMGKSSTIVFPMPLDMFQNLAKKS